jgi:hypothetical protein
MKYNKLNKSKYKYKGGRIFGRKEKSISVNAEQNVVPKEKSFDFKKVMDKGLKHTSRIRNKLNISDTQASNILGLSEIGDEENKEKAEMLKDKKLKIEKKSKELAKSSAGLLVDVFYNFGFNVVNMYIYLISSLINLPNNTLENIIPEKGGCNLFFSDESTCKKKIKCLFKKCTILEDKEGYILDYKQEQRDNTAKEQKGGIKKHLDPKSCKYKSESCKSYPSDNYNTVPPLALYPILKGNSPGLNIKHVTSQIKKTIYSPISRINKINLLGGTTLQTQSTNNENLENSFPRKNQTNTQIEPTVEKQKAKAQAMLLYAVIKENMNIENIYKFLLLMKMMKLVYGDVEELETHIETSREDDNIKLFNQKPEIVNIPFPFNHALLDTPSERVECLMAHLMGQTPEDFENNPTLKTCFLCKSCTLMGQSSQVIKDLYEQLIDGSNLTFSEIFKTLFDLFSNVFNYNVDAKKFLLQIIVNFKMNDRALNIDDGFFRKQIIPHHSYKDTLLMIPEMKIKNGIDTENNEVFKQNKHLYAYFKSMEMENVLSSYLYQQIYLVPINEISENKRVKNIKENIRLILGCQKSFLPSKKATELDQVLKLLDRVTAKDLEPNRPRDTSPRKGLLRQILDNEAVNNEDLEHYEKYSELYTKIVNNDVTLENIQEEEKNDSWLKSVIEKLQTDDK